MFSCQLASQTTRMWPAVLLLVVVACALPTPEDAPVAASVPAVDAVTQCCPSGPMRRDAHCVHWPNRSHLKLQCPRGMFALMPHQSSSDEFSISGGGLLQFGDDAEVERDKFCLGHLLLDDNTTVDMALVCFDDEPEEGPSMRGVLNGVCLFISVVFLLATLVVYVLLPELRDLDGRVLMCYIGSLAMGYTILALMQFHGHSYSDELCIGSSFILYFLMLSAFFWLNVVCFNIWRKTVNVRLPVTENSLFPLYCLYGYGAPLLFLVVAIVADNLPGDHQKPQFGLSKCWFHSSVDSWVYFYGPVAALILCNIIFFVWTAWSLWRSQNSADHKLRSLRFKCRMYLKLAILMGVSWIFEIISFILDDQYPFFWYVTDVINCLQGVIIFTVIVLLRKRVLRLLVKRRPCGMAPPERWAKGVDEESEAMLAEEELAYTQPAI